MSVTLPRSGQVLPVPAASVGVLFPRRPRAIEPLTSLSPLPLPLAVSPTFAGVSWSVREPPRPP